MPKTQTPTTVHEYEHLIDFSLDGYIHALDLPIPDIIRTIKVNRGQFETWRRRKICPLAVWKRMCSLWGSQGFADDRIGRTRRPYRLHESYAPVLGIEPPPPPPAAPTPPPEAVSWAIFEGACQLLLNQNAALVAQVTQQTAEIDRLTRRVALLENGESYTHLAPPKPLPEAPRPEIRAEALNHLRRIAPQNGKREALSDLETRLGKAD